MNDDELLTRHLNGDLDGAELGAFLSRVQESPELRRKLASLALHETLLAEVVREGRRGGEAAPSRRLADPRRGGPHARGPGRRPVVCP